MNKMGVVVMSALCIKVPLRSCFEIHYCGDPVAVHQAVLHYKPVPCNNIIFANISLFSMMIYK